MTEDILFTQIAGNNGDVALITLNRPKQLNALTTEMCRLIYDKLNEWEQDINIKAAFCAGGDLKNFYQMGNTEIETAKEFFWHEYRLNHRIFTFSKPYISLLHGITMGGGAGISVHGSHRVAAEDLIWAMPETGIGFFPDIGSSYFLPRLLDKTGFYLGLTGDKLSALDAHYIGVIDTIVPRNRFDDLINVIAKTEFSADARASVTNLIEQFSIAPTASVLLTHRIEIDRCFSRPTVEEIIKALFQEKIPWSVSTAEVLQTKSPTSLKVTLAELNHGMMMNDFAACMKMEFRIANHFLHNKDFYEGIRAALIDKDRKPKWYPARLAEMTDDDVKKYFAPLTTELSMD
jgi:enoyl-CoA hydratase/carnithine racemase